MKLLVWQKIVVGLILLFSFIILISSSRGDSVTYDEKVHIPAGYLHVFKGDYTYNTEHPSLANDLSGFFVGLFAKPHLPVEKIGDLNQYQYGEKFLYENGNNAQKILFWGRLPILLLTLVLFYLVFLWAWEVWGFKAGVLALLLVVSCPNLLANGRLATTDLILVLAFVLNFYILRKFILKSSWANACLLGLVTGLALLSKFSGLIVIPLNIILYFLILFVRKDKFRAENILKIIVGLAIAFFMVWLVYLFSMRLNLLEAFRIWGLGWYGGLGWFKGLAKWLTLPLLKFWEGFGMVSDHDRLGHLAYLNGQFSYQGWWYYFPYAFWYKTPIPAMILFILAIIFSFFQKKKLWEILLIILPPLIFFIFSMKSHINIGLRHIILIFPLIYIFISQLANLKNLLFKIFVWGLVLGNVIISLYSFPDYISYFNVNAGGKTQAYKHLADSNLDWGQNIKRLKLNLDKEKIDQIYLLCNDEITPRYFGINFVNPPLNKPEKGIVGFCAQQYIFIPSDLNLRQYSWLREYPPDEIIANTIYLWRFLK